MKKIIKKKAVTPIKVNKKSKVVKSKIKPKSKPKTKDKKVTKADVEQFFEITEEAPFKFSELKNQLKFPTIEDLFAPTALEPDPEPEPPVNSEVEINDSVQEEINADSSLTNHTIVEVPVEAKPEVKVEVKPEVNVEVKPEIMLNTPTTKEQQAGIPKVIGGNSFESVRRIDSLSLSEQIDTIFNPLHTITQTTISDKVSESTHIVEHKPDVKG